MRSEGEIALPSCNQTDSSVLAGLTWSSSISQISICVGMTAMSFAVIAVSNMCLKLSHSTTAHQTAMWLSSTGFLTD